MYLLYYKKADSLFSKYETDEYEKLKFMKEVFKIISMSEKGDTSPYLNTRIMRFLNSKFNLGDIYYIFLCKCDLFNRRFNIEKFKGIFANERNVKDMIGYNHN